MNETTNLYSSGYTQKLFVEPDYSASLERGGKRRCLGCMHLYDAEFDVCPRCGYTVNTEIEYANILYPGTILNKKYMVGKAIAINDFCATYLAWDTELRRRVAINEYLPVGFSLRTMNQLQLTVFPGESGVRYEEGLERFIEEYSFLSNFRRERALSTVFDIFEENKTAYAVTEFLEGETLEELLEENGPMSFEDAMDILSPVASLLKTLNASGVYHLNITPSNIFFSEKGETKLINFGSVMRCVIADRRSLDYESGYEEYAAEEIYRSNGDTGSHSDVYSLAAVMYKMLTGYAPAGAMERRAAFEKTGKDILVSVDKYLEKLPKNKVNAIHNALNIAVQDRTPDIKEFLAELRTDKSVRRKRNKIKRTDRLDWPVAVRIAVPVVAAIALVCGLLLFTGVIGPRTNLKKDYTVPIGQTVVPDVTTMDLIEVEKLLSECNLRFVISDTVSNSVTAKETVIKQFPDVGAVVNIGETLRLTLSSGPGLAIVDDVKGFAVENARELLEKRGFKVTVRSESNSEYAKDVVFSQSVKNSEQEKGTEITLYVSEGNSSIVRTKEVEIPSLEGRDYETERKVLKSDGLYLAIEKVTYNPKIPDGQIISQSPQKGKKNAHAGDIITVTINKQVRNVYIPDVEKMKLETAADLLESLGLKTDIRYEQNARVAKGSVISQGTESGTTVPAGTTVVLTVSEGFKSEVPDVRGETVERAQEILLESGFSSLIVGFSEKSVKNTLVVSQSINPGTVAESGKEVALVAKKINN